MSANPILAEALRGGLVESFHRGALAIVDADGTVHTALGDIDRPIFPRSAVKVLQALPLVASGAAQALGLSDEELVRSRHKPATRSRHIPASRRVAEKRPEGLSSVGHFAADFGVRSRAGLEPAGATFGSR